MTLKPGSRLGHFEIVSLLGSGGMGEVYRARDTRLGRDVAVKVLRTDLVQDEERLKRFEREARAASGLNHPNIVQIYDIGEHEGSRFIAMECVDGQSLRKLFENGPLPTKKLIKIATQTAEGLAKAHAAGIVHRDLKPENIMVTDDGYVKIIDFGLAKLRPRGAELDSELSTLDQIETHDGVVLGTVGYMSPEQVKGQAADFRSDQFSLGVVLYEAATGRRPFSAGSVAEIFSAVLKEEPAPITESSARVPATLARVIERCLAKAPEERYDSTRDLVMQLEDLGADARARGGRAKGRLAASAASIGLLAVLLTVFYWLGNPREPGGTGLPRVESVAVLPLNNLSGDPEQEYFVAGMHEALITVLSKIGALKVISRTSVMRFQETDKSLPEIARELGVDAVIEGSVLRAGDRVRITAQLVHGATDEHLWAESYDRDLEDVLTLQSEVARAIAEEIQVTLTPEEKVRLAEAPPVDPEVYELYLKGRHHLGQATDDGLRQSIEHFEKALEKDPDFALAYVGLAESYFWGGMSMLPPDEARSKGRFYARKAVELGDKLDEAHRILAMMEAQDWEWEAAEKELKRSLELNPNSADAHDTYSILLLRLGRTQEAVAEEEEALKLNPLSHFINCNAPFVYAFDNQTDRAIEQARQSTELFGSACPFEALSAGKAYSQKGMFEEAIVGLEERKALKEEQPRIIAELGYAYAKAGRADDAREILDELEELATRKPVDPYLVAAVHVALGDADEAFRLLERAYQERTFFVANLNVDPQFAPLHDDPRFSDLLTRLNFRPGQ